MPGKHIATPAILMICLLSIAASGTEVERRIELPVHQSIQTRQATQKEEEQWRTDKEKLTARFEQLLSENKELQTHGRELRQTIETTEIRLAGKKKQIEDIARITQEIQPFLDELLQMLTQAAATGPPFLRTERQERIDKLRAIMANPAVDLSEKYRKIMEALLVEAEYGFTTEVYQENIPLNGQDILVDIFRLGRLSLFYLTLDQRQCGFYNMATKTWLPLPVTHLHAIRTAVSIGAKRQPVELLNLPVGRMVRR